MPEKSSILPTVVPPPPLSFPNDNGMTSAMSSTGRRSVSPRPPSSSSTFSFWTKQTSNNNGVPEHLPSALALDNLSCYMCGHLKSLESMWWCRECAMTVCSSCNLLKGHTDHVTAPWSYEELAKSAIKALQDRCHLRTNKATQDQLAIKEYMAEVEQYFSKRISQRLSDANTYDRTQIDALVEAFDLERAATVYSYDSNALRNSTQATLDTRIERTLAELSRFWPAFSVAKSPHLRPSGSSALRKSRFSIPEMPVDEFAKLLQDRLNIHRTSSTRMNAVAIEGSGAVPRWSGLSSQQSAAGRVSEVMYECLNDITMSVSSTSLNNNSNSPLIPIEPKIHVLNGPMMTSSPAQQKHFVPELKHVNHSYYPPDAKHALLSQTALSYPSSARDYSGGDYLSSTTNSSFEQTTGIGTMSQPSTPRPSSRSGASGSGGGGGGGVVRSFLRGLSPTRRRRASFGSKGSSSIKSVDLSDGKYKRFPYQDNEVIQHAIPPPTTDASLLMKTREQPLVGSSSRAPAMSSSSTQTTTTAFVPQKPTPPSLSNKQQQTSLDISNQVPISSNAVALAEAADPQSPVPPTPGGRLLMINSSAYRIGEEFLTRPIDVCVLPNCRLAISDSCGGVYVTNFEGDILSQIWLDGASASSLHYCPSRHELSVGVMQKEGREIRVYNENDFELKEVIACPTKPEIAMARTRWIARAKQGDFYIVSGDNIVSVIWHLRYNDAAVRNSPASSVSADGMVKSNSNRHIWSVLKHSPQSRYQYLCLIEDWTDFHVMITCDSLNGYLLMFYVGESGALEREYNLNEYWTLSSQIRGAASAIYDEYSNMLILDHITGKVFQLSWNERDRARMVSEIAEIGGPSPSGAIGLCAYSGWVFVACYASKSVRAFRYL